MKGPKPPFPKAAREGDAPISDAYPVIDTDLARDNLENDIPAADLQDLRSGPTKGRRSSAGE